MEEEAGFLLAAGDEVVGGDADVGMVGVGDVDEAVDVVDEDFVGGAGKEGADEGGVGELVLGTGETDGEHGVEAVLDLGEGVEPGVVEEAALFPPAKEGVEFDELDLLSHFFDGHV